MLSVADLLSAGTQTPPLAAYLFAAIGRGASFMVGARPGGAGKTTVMGALLNAVPADVPLHAADSAATIAAGCDARLARRCYVCHEISPGDYYAYLWDEDLRQYFRLSDSGHMLATNLHADTYGEARDQVCGDNGVPEAHLRRMNLILFVQVEGWNGPRRIASVWEGDGNAAHRRIYDVDGGGFSIDESHMVSPAQWQSANRLIERILQSGIRTIREVREEVVREDPPLRGR